MTPELWEFIAWALVAVVQAVMLAVACRHLCVSWLYSKLSELFRGKDQP